MLSFADGCDKAIPTASYLGPFPCAIRCIPCAPSYFEGKESISGLRDNSKNNSDLMR